MNIRKLTILLRSSGLGKNTAWKNKEYSSFILCHNGIFSQVLRIVICFIQNQSYTKVFLKSNKKEARDVSIKLRHESALE
jgi:hypothetical protein